MIVLLLVGGLIVALLFFAQIIGFALGGIWAWRERPSRQTQVQEPPSHVRLLESHEVTEEDLEGWDGKDELEI